MRRVHVSQVVLGRTVLDPFESHHLKNVLRVEQGESVELFDSAGRSAAGSIIDAAGDSLVVEIAAITCDTEPALRLTIAAAVPKGDRADWMIEKLSELGVAAFVPLAAERSVVLPTGKGKADRWGRIAIESAKQSHRTGVMTIAALTPVADALQTAGDGAFVASVSPGAERLAAASAKPPLAPTLFIGPEGGWTNDELQRFTQAGATAVRLTTTILRIETAAIAGAAVLLCR